MAFTIPVTLTQTGLVSPNQTVTKTSSITQEIVTQIQVTVPSGSTVPVNLNILNVDEINLLAFITNGEVTFKFDYTGNTGWSYSMKDIVVLYNDSLHVYDNTISSISNELKVIYVTNPNASADVTFNAVVVTSND